MDLDYFVEQVDALMAKVLRARTVPFTVGEYFFSEVREEARTLCCLYGSWRKSAIGTPAEYTEKQNLGIAACYLKAALWRLMQYWEGEYHKSPEGSKRKVLLFLTSGRDLLLWLWVVQHKPEAEEEWWPAAWESEIKPNDIAALFFEAGSVIDFADDHTAERFYYLAVDPKRLAAIA